MRLAIACTVIGIGLAGCAVEPGDPQVKINYGDGPMPPFTELNYAVDFGRRCSPPDAQGRHYSSFVWLMVGNRLAIQASSGSGPTTAMAATMRCVPRRNTAGPLPPCRPIDPRSSQTATSRLV